jgi:hypothetical protein
VFELRELNSRCRRSYVFEEITAIHRQLKAYCMPSISWRQLRTVSPEKRYWDNKMVKFIGSAVEKKKIQLPIFPGFNFRLRDSKPPNFFSFIDISKAGVLFVNRVVPVRMVYKINSIGLFKYFFELGITHSHLIMFYL